MTPEPPGPILAYLAARMWRAALRAVGNDPARARILIDLAINGTEPER